MYILDFIEDILVLESNQLFVELVLLSGGKRYPVYKPIPFVASYN